MYFPVNVHPLTYRTSEHNSLNHAVPILELLAPSWFGFPSYPGPHAKHGLSATGSMVRACYHVTFCLDWHVAAVGICWAVRNFAEKNAKLSDFEQHREAGARAGNEKNEEECSGAWKEPSVCTLLLPQRPLSLTKKLFVVLRKGELLQAHKFHQVYRQQQQYQWEWGLEWNKKSKAFSDGQQLVHAWSDYCDWKSGSTANEDDSLLLLTIK